VNEEIKKTRNRRIVCSFGPVSVFAVANAFLGVARERKKKLTNMQLQKLAFIANGFSLAILGRPLYYQENRAWQFGPVVPELYKRLQRFGKGDVTEEINSTDELDPNSKEMDLIRSVFDAYRQKTAFTLTKLINKPGTPWNKIWKEDPYGIIPQRLIRKHYRELLENV
jgi:uncharacterized phage-associated protein